MLIPYNKSKALTGFTHEQLLELTGIYGVHGKKVFFQWLGNGLIGYRIEVNNVTNELTITIKSPLKVNLTVIKELTVIVKSKTEIYNASFLLHDWAKNSNGNYGFKRLYKEIITARKLGIKRITLWAYGNYREIKKWTGYLIWGKYGFTMYEVNEILKFQFQMVADNLPHKVINSLVVTKEGTAYWKHTGWDWKGEFETQPTSSHFKILKRYARGKKIALSKI